MAWFSAYVRVVSGRYADEPFLAPAQTGLDEDPRHAVERPDEGVVDHLDAVVVREPVPERVEVREHGGERDREAGQAGLA